MPIDALSAPSSVSDDVRAGRPWWKICCGGCCLLVMLAFVGILILWRGIGGGHGPQTLAQLPSNFPPAITLYRVSDARSIEYFAGSDKNRAFSALLSPLKFFGSIMVTRTEHSGPTSTAAQPFQHFMDVNASRLQQSDTVTVNWKNLDASRDALESWYLQEFQRLGFTVDQRHDDATASNVIIAERNDIGVQVLTQDLPDVPGIDTVTVVVDYFNQTE